jgi:hypothetical protein
MSNLQTTLMNIIDECIDKYNNKIASKYDLDVEELNELWKNISKDEKVVEKKVVEKKVVEKKVVEKKVVEKVSPVGSSNCCPYVLAKGTNAGEQCGCKPKNGAVYCSKHKKYEGTASKSAKKSPLPVPKKTIVPTTKKVTPPIKKPNLVLIRNKKINKFVHQESGLVFKSEKEKNVIGKLRDDKIDELSDEDISNCKKYGFKYEIKPVEPEEKEEEDEEVDEEEKEEVDEQVDEKVDEEEVDDEEVDEQVDEKVDEEEVDDEEVDEEEVDEKKINNMMKISRKITAVPEKLQAKEATNFKKSINKAITNTNAQVEDVEEILNKLNINTQESDSEDEFEEQDFEEQEFEDLDEEY